MLNQTKCCHAKRMMAAKAPSRPTALIGYRRCRVQVVKLPSAKMFYQYLKKEKCRVPHYLKKLEDDSA